MARINEEEQYQKREDDLAERICVLHTEYGSEVASVAVSHIISCYRREIETDLLGRSERDFRKMFGVCMLMQACSFFAGFSLSHWIMPWIHGG